MASQLPTHGTSKDDVLARLRAMHGDDAKWRDGKTFSLVYNAGVNDLLKEAYAEFIAENGLSPVAFPSLRKMECEVVSMSAALMHGDDEVAGTMTSGGTESIMMAVKAARDFAKKTKGVTQPELLVPCTAHPAFDKAAHYFGVKIVHAKQARDLRVDLEDLERRITPNTVMIVGSAPPYPHGVIDPIPEIAAIARRHDLWCHVDACLGGFFLPFAEKLGRQVPPWDFRVQGVHSISADLHKYGYAAKGASVVLYRTSALRRHQFFTWAGWNGGLYASPSFCGTRPGGAIAAAWAVMQHLGEAGYLERARTVLETAKAMQKGIETIDGLRVLGAPDMGVFAFSSETLNVYELGDAMDARGWKLDRQMDPPALHLMVSPAHAKVLEQFLHDLKECAASLSSGHPAPEGSAAMYGMVGAVGDRSQVNEFLLDFLDGLFERG